jgi:hypothetical protein
MDIGKAIGYSFLIYLAVGTVLLLMGVPDGAGVAIAGIVFIVSLVAMAASGTGEQAKRNPSSSKGHSASSGYATMSEKQRRKEDDEQFEVLLNTSVFDEWDGQ